MNFIDFSLDTQFSFPSALIVFFSGSRGLEEFSVRKLPVHFHGLYPPIRYKVGIIDIVAALLRGGPTYYPVCNLRIILSPKCKFAVKISIAVQSLCVSETAYIPLAVV